MEQFEDFKVALRKFVQEVCETIPKEKVPRRLWTRIVRQQDGSVAYPQEERPDITRFLFRLLMTFHTNPTETLLRVIDIVRSDTKLASALLVDGAGGLIVDEHSQQWWATNKLSGDFLRAYFAHMEQYDFDEQAFDAMFHQLVVDLESPIIALTELSPLINARLDCERIDIIPGLSIRKLSIDELERWLNEYMEFPFLSVFGFSTVDPSSMYCAIETTYKKDRHEVWGASQGNYQKVSDLLTVIRLLTDQNVHIAFTKQISHSMLHQMGLGTSSSLSTRLPSMEARISLSMQQEIVNTWQHIQALPSDSAIRLALRRWDLVAEELNEDDKLIDYWIALESLFIPESHQEVRYRASLRTAAFIGDTLEEREEMYGKLRNSYDLRSDIVHGKAPKRKDRSDLIGKTRSYLSRALLKVLTSDEPFEPQSIESKLLRKGI